MELNILYFKSTIPPQLASTHSYSFSCLSCTFNCSLKRLCVAMYVLIVSVLLGDLCRLIIKRLYDEYKVRVEAIQTIALVHFMQETLSFEDMLW